MSASLRGLPTVQQVRAEIAKRSLAEYIRQAWHVVEPATPYVHGWHISAIAEHLEAVTRGQIKQLLINMPPRHGKSLVVSVFWPTWEWLTYPEHRWLFASYALSLSIRDSLKCRRLIQSPWYQASFGDVFKLTEDQNAKIRFENDKLGYRLATSVGGALTGEGGDRIVADDPHNVREAESSAMRESTLTWWDEAMSTRLNDQRTGAKVIVMQRVHAQDLSGHVLEQGGWEHLCLPAEYEESHRTTSIGWKDPRRQEGDLLWPERVGQDELARLKVQLGSYAYAGQFQQRPSPRAGGMFKRHWWKRFGAFDRESAEAVIQVWDTAFKEKRTADYSACSTWAKTASGLYVLDAFRERLEFPDLKRKAEDLFQKWRPNAVLVEDKASGQSLIQELKRDTLMPIIAIPVDRDKIARAAAATPYVEAGKVYLPEQAEWVDDWIEEHAAFPAGAHDDQVDTTSMAIAALTEDPEPEEETVTYFDPVRISSW